MHNNVIFFIDQSINRALSSLTASSNNWFFAAAAAGGNNLLWLLTSSFGNILRSGVDW